MNNYYQNSTNRRTIPIIRIGKVVYNVDPDSAGIIKVNITGIDKLESDENLIDCVPLLPKYLTIMPEVGESVFVFQYEDQEGNPTSKFHSKRFWIGPLISQPTKLSYDPAEESNSILPDGWSRLKDPNLEEGAYGNKQDITLQGRYNTDIIQKDREIWIRTGKFDEGANNKFNNKNLGYIQLKYGGDKLKRVLEDKEVIRKISPKITTILTVDIITFVTQSNGNGIVPLANNLPASRYKESDVKKTTYTIKINNTQSTTPIGPFTQDFNGQNSRELAVSTAKNIIDTYKGNQWRINSSAIDLLKEYPNYSEEGHTAVWSITPTEVRDVIKEVKMIPNDEKKSSVINIVANKINLISHDGNNTFELANPKSLITDDEQEIINNEAHPMVYGDKLLEFLELVKKYVNLHVHPYHGMSPDNDEVKLDVLRYDLDSILNKNINTN